MPKKIKLFLKISSTVLSDILEKITGNFIEKAEQLAQKKEQDIHTV